MIWTYGTFLHDILIMSVISSLPSYASIKEEIPDLNIAIGIEDDIQPQYSGFRPKTQRDRHLQALMKIQKKERGTALQNLRLITQRERKLQSMIKVQKLARITYGPAVGQAVGSSSSTSTSINMQKSRVRAKTKPQYPSHL